MAVSTTALCGASLQFTSSPSYGLARTCLRKPVAQFLPRQSISFGTQRAHSSFFGSSKLAWLGEQFGFQTQTRPSEDGGSRGHRAPGSPVNVEAKKGFGFGQLLANNGKVVDEVAAGKKRQPLKRGRVSPKLEVPPHILRPPYADSGKHPAWSDENQVHDEQGIERMRAAGQLAARVRDYAGTLVKPGVTTDEIDKAVHKMIVEAGAYPSPLNYGRFPKSVCTSINECICHGIPDSRPLQDGDIINIDVTVYLNGYHGDTSATFFCGNVSQQARTLVQVTKEVLDKAIAVCAPGVEYKKIGKTIQEHADKHKFGVVRHFVGHGGSIKDEMWDDNWTAVTADGGLSAQFEHTLLITKTGVEILTL
eukprot:jgi/Mesen1/1197/ME000128S00171